MLNAEKFKEKLLEISSNSNVFAVKKGTVEPVDCDDARCCDCIFDRHCSVGRTKWLCSEYVEPKKYPVLTRFEKELLERLSTEYEYIARDLDGKIYVSTRKPIKSIRTFTLEDVGRFYRLSNSIDVFPFVKWEDKEAWSIQELILNCEVV